MERQNAIAYCRVSDPRQVKRKRRDEPTREKDSLDRQEAKARECAMREGFTFLEPVWLELGESAKTDDRTVLWNMYAWCKKHQGLVHVLIIPKIDRFARNSEDYHSLKRKFRDLGVRIVSVDEQIDDTPEGHLSENIHAAFAQFDNERRAERSKEGQVEAFLAGRWIWPAPYGYRHVTLIDGSSNIAPFEEEARYVRRAFELLDLKLCTVAEAYRILRSEGMLFSGNGFYHLVKNPVYAGVFRGLGREVEPARPYEPLVPLDRFWRVQALLQRRGAGQSKPNQLNHADFPLRGTIRCACRRYHTASWSTGKLGGRYGYYRCTACERVNHRRDNVEADWLSLLTSRRMPESVFDDAATMLLQRWQARRELSSRQAVDVDRERKRLVDIQGALARKIAEGVIPADIGRQQIDAIRIEAAALTSPAANPDDPSLDEALELGRDLITNPARFWERAHLTERKKFQRFLLSEGVVYTQKTRFGNPAMRLLEPVSTISASNIKGWGDKESNIGNLQQIGDDLLAFYKTMSDD